MRIKRRIPRPLPRPDVQMPRMPRRPPRSKPRPIDWEEIADMPRLPGRPGPGTVANLPPRMAPPRRMPINMPRVPREAPVRQGPPPSMTGEDYILPEPEEFHPGMPPKLPRSDTALRPPWEGRIQPGWVPGGSGGGVAVGGSEDKFDLSPDVMNALLEMLFRNRAGGVPETFLGGRAY